MKTVLALLFAVLKDKLMVWKGSLKLYHLQELLVGVSYLVCF